ncbi:MAG: FmdE family protein [Candidatus Bathyarchaeia archaeon]
MRETLKDFMEKAEEFHGHLGPFLVLGLKIGLLGLKKLNMNRGSDGELHVTVMLDYSIPFSCMIDGLQVSTGCTVGNKRLTVKDSSDFIVEFFNKRDNKCIVISIDQKILNEILDKLKTETKNSKKVFELVKKIISAADDELFLIYEK